ncbi:MAG: PadR family transcriptional regulator [Acidobacteria bacterium]|nr:PadR family transcriptional regulator [Acidobacteriota bacterium]
MARKPSDILQGTLTLLVLKTLAARGPLHGYGIATHLLEASEDALRVEEGSLYPALHRMEEEGWVKATWGMSELSRRARFYAITAAGKRQLASEEARWAGITAAVNRVLRYV